MRVPLAGPPSGPPGMPPSCNGTKGGAVIDPVIKSMEVDRLKMQYPFLDPNE